MSLKQLIPAEEALRTVLDGAKPVGTEKIALGEAAERILAGDLAALRTQPPFDASAMDGYAVRQANIATLPVKLKVTGESRAGVPFNGTLNSGEAVRIFTGAVVPEGADSIVIQENTERTSEQSVQINFGVEQGRFIRKAGLDFHTGEVLLKAGDQLTASRLALAASMNHANFEVFQKPKVAVISTGDELVLPGRQLEAGQIIASNTYGIIASTRACGGEVLDCGIVKDEMDKLSGIFLKAMENGADIIVTTGGASVGDHDLVMPVAQSLGFEFQIAKIAMRPGKPFLFATIQHEGRTVYLTGLAGNPVSSIVAFNVFVRPLIQLLSGQNAQAIKLRPAILGRDLPANDERAEYMRAIAAPGEDGELIATPFASQDSSMLANLVRANCLIYRAVKAPAAMAGDRVTIVPIAGT